MSHPLIRIVPVAVAVGAVVAAATVTNPIEASGTAAAPVDAALPPVQSVLVCPPPPALAQGAEGAGTDAGFAAQPVAPVSTLTAFTYRGGDKPATLTAHTAPVGGKPEAIKATGNAAVNTLTGARPAPVWLAAAPDASGSPAIGALTTTLTPEGDLAGLAASTCAPVDSVGWLVAGGVAAGRSGRIVLSNPGATPVTVDLRVLTSSGPQSPPSGQDVVVAPGGSKQVLLEGLTSTTGPMAIGYTASGGQIAANLVDNALAGITPRGVEQVPATRPGTTITLTPLQPGARTLRLANPGTETAQITWRFIGAEGTVPSAEAAGAAVPPGQLAEVPIAVPKGATGIEVSSETAILASVITVIERDSATGKAADNAVLSATAPLARHNLVAAGPVRTTIGLVAGPDQDATVEIRQVDATGKAITGNQTLALPKDTARTVAMAPGAALALIEVTAGTVHGGLMMTAGEGDRFVAAAPLQPPATSQESVSVQVVRRP